MGITCCTSLVLEFSLLSLNSSAILKSISMGVKSFLLTLVKFPWQSLTNNLPFSLKYTAIHSLFFAWKCESVQVLDGSV